MNFSAEDVSCRPTQAQRYACYAAYVLVAPLVGLVRLIVAVAALIIDKYEHSMIESAIEREAEVDQHANPGQRGRRRQIDNRNIFRRGWDRFTNRAGQTANNLERAADDLAQAAQNLVANAAQGNASTRSPILINSESRMARNWQQLARALSELVVVGSFFYAFTEAANPDVPVIQHHCIRVMACEESLLSNSRRGG